MRDVSITEKRLSVSLWDTMHKLEDSEDDKNDYVKALRQVEVACERLINFLNPSVQDPGTGTLYRKPRHRG